MRYWIWWNDLIQGPFDLDELVSLKAFSEDLLVCMEDRSDWLPAGRVADLSSEIEQLRSRRAAPLTPPPPPPQRPPMMTPLQGEFFTEPQEQQSLLDSEDGPKGPYAYRPVTLGSDPDAMTATYLIGQVTMPFHFSRQPLSSTPVLDLPPSAAPAPERSRVMYSAPPVTKESPLRKPVEEEPVRVPLSILKEEILEEPAAPVETAAPLPERELSDIQMSKAPLFTEPAVEERKLSWLPWILGVVVSVAIIASLGYWMMDRANTSSAISEARQMESPKPPELAPVMPPPVAEPAPPPARVSLWKKILSVFGVRRTPRGDSPSSPISSPPPPVSSPSVQEAEPKSSPALAKQESPKAVMNEAQERIAPPEVSAPPAASPASSASGPMLRSTRSAVKKIISALIHWFGFGHRPAAALPVAAVSAGVDMTAPAKTLSVAAPPADKAPLAPSVTPRKSSAASKKSRHTLTKKKPAAHRPRSGRVHAVAPPPVTPEPDIPLDTDAPVPPESHAASEPAAKPVEAPADLLPGVSGAKSNSVTPINMAAPASVPAPAMPASLTPVSMTPDPWKGKQSDAIRLVTNKALPKSKITIGSQAKSMLQEMHEKELMHAAETGERLYLPDKMAWAALQEEGSNYRVYLNFIAWQANGERLQSRSYQFLVNLQNKEVRTEDAATLQDILTTSAELTFKHNPMATDIDSILGGVDTYNKHLVQRIIVKKNNRNREGRQKIEIALNAAQAKVKRAIIYFRRVYNEKALQNIAKAYQFTELLKG